VSLQHFSRSLRVPVPVDALFAWHEREGAFERLSPPWQDVRVRSREGGIRDGATVTLEVRTAGVPTTWHVVHRDYVHNARFVDEMRGGPFARWVHTHAFAAETEASSRLDDGIEYALPFDGLGDLVAAPMRHRHGEGLAEEQRVVFDPHGGENARELAAQGTRRDAVQMQHPGRSRNLGRRLAPFGQRHQEGRNLANALLHGLEPHEFPVEFIQNLSDLRLLEDGLEVYVHQ
jgi:ligand-binding SRPBCC domain-containing protein